MRSWREPNVDQRGAVVQSTPAMAPKMTGHRHCSSSSPPRAAEGVGACSYVPVRKDPHVMTAARGATQEKLLPAGAAGTGRWGLAGAQKQRRSPFGGDGSTQSVLGPALVCAPSGAIVLLHKSRAAGEGGDGDAGEGGQLPCPAPSSWRGRCRPWYLRGRGIQTTDCLGFERQKNSSYLLEFSSCVREDHHE
jgi:hypothetical protein